MQFTRPFGYAVSQPPLPFDLVTIMRSPGNYELGKAILQTVRGVTPAQRLEPWGKALRGAAQKAARVEKKSLAVGALGLAGLALGAITARKKPHAKR
jgi:hypothetical protein